MSILRDSEAPVSCSDLVFNIDGLLYSRIGDYFVWRHRVAKHVDGLRPFLDEQL